MGKRTLNGGLTFRLPLVVSLAFHGALILLAAATLPVSARNFAGHAPGNALLVESWDISRRHDYRQSLKKPFFFHNDQTTVPYFEYQGNVLASNDELRLTSSLPNQRGAVWTEHPNPHKEWQVTFSFNVFGRASTGGDGFALWYAKEKNAVGSVYGSKDKWEGLAVIFDTADVKELRSTPFIYGIVNDGKHEYDGNDYLATAIGGCFRDYRNSPHPVWGRLTYANQTLRLDMDLRQGGYSYSFCFEKANINLPPGYHFGVSASTSEQLHDDHDLLSLEVWEMNPHEKKGQAAEPAMDEETRKKIELIESAVREAREREARERGEPSNQEAFSPHVIQEILENQFKMIESLNILFNKVGEAPVVAAGVTHENTKRNVDEAVTPLNMRLTELDKRIEELGHKIEQNVKLRDLSVQLQKLADDIHGMLGRVHEQSRKGDASLQDIASKLASSNEKLDETHSAITKTASSSHYLFYLMFFAIGGVLSYVGSVMYRMRNSPKKFI
ncbi:legume-like lectin family-domain-containing protein [Zopfochytrium polystomum]|nr:legume-like lectin family-domain-containing protein [Zopfochytrium polystomum]